MQILSNYDKFNFQISRNSPQTMFRGLNMKPKISSDIVNLSGDNFLRLSKKDISARIKASLSNPDNKLGFGGEAEVWRIEGTNYCVRIPHGSFGKYEAKPHLRLTEKDCIKHTVAKLANGVTIMPIIEGYTFFSDKISNEELSNKLLYMPQEAFNKLFMQVYHAEQNKLYFDCGAKNVIINPEANTLTAIDFCDNKDPFYQKRILNELFLTFSLVRKDDNRFLRILAAKLLSVPIEIIKQEPKMDIDLNYCGFSKFVDLLKERNVIQNLNYVRVLKNNFDKIVNLNLQKINSQSVLELSGQIKIAQALIQQLRFGLL